MTVAERQQKIIEEIHAITDEHTLEMLEETLIYYTNTKVDVTDGLSPYEFKELESLVSEPSDKDVVSEEAYKKATDKWRTK